MDLLFQLLIIIFSVVIHEVSHGYAALMLGDKTAQYAGRLTLNPVKHVDPFGSILLPAMLAFMNAPVIAWAKPVPYNPYNLRNQQWGPAVVGAAGPAANMAIALFFALIIRFTPAIITPANGLYVMNFLTIASAIAFLNLLLALFNLLPIPPLDGSKLLYAFLPYRWRGLQQFLDRFGFVVLLFFIFFFSHWLSVVVLFLFRLLAGTLPF